MRNRLTVEDRRLELEIRNLSAAEPREELLQKLIYDLQSESKEQMRKSPRGLVLFFFILRDWAADHWIAILVVVFLAGTALAAALFLLGVV